MTSESTDIRICTKCGKPRLIRDFSMTTGRGKKYRRTWCKYCMKRYYTGYSSTTRVRNRELARLALEVVEAAKLIVNMTCNDSHLESAFDGLSWAVKEFEKVEKS